MRLLRGAFVSARDANCHTWGEPGPYCIGPPHSEEHLEDPLDYEDHENALIKELKHLELAEKLLEKATRVRQLKIAIEESHKRLAELQQLQGSPLSGLELKTSGASQATYNAAPLSTQINPAAADPANASNVAVPVASNFAVPVVSNVAVPIASNVLASSVPVAPQRKTNSPVTPLDTLLAGHPTCAGPQAFVNNPDGALTGPQADQKSMMFLKPAQMAKGENVHRIIDFVDKIVSTVEDRTLSEIGATKLVVS